MSAMSSADHPRSTPGLSSQPASLDSETSILDTIVGNSPALHDAFERIERVAPTNATVFITGETGTGKELVARAVHRRSLRATRPLVAVNVGAVPESFIASELFGYEEGAFTVQRRIGRFEQADRATLFLDEVGELSKEIQVAFCAWSRTARSSGSVARKRGTSMSGSSPRRIACSKRRWNATRSGRICSIVSACFRSTCRRCASGWRTFRRWSTTSCARSGGSRSAVHRYRARVARTAARVQLARQHPPAREHHRAERDSLRRPLLEGGGVARRRAAFDAVGHLTARGSAPAQRAAPDRGSARGGGGRVSGRCGAAARLGSRRRRSNRRSGAIASTNSATGSRPSDARDPIGLRLGRPRGHH